MAFLVGIGGVAMLMVLIYLDFFNANNNTTERSNAHSGRYINRHEFIWISETCYVAYPASRAKTNVVVQTAIVRLFLRDR